ncbi:glycoside hydrolase family 16 protein, partial [Piedraia hortae CBS 480.64]
VLSLLLASAAAQTSTVCNPLNSTNCPHDPALGTTYQTVFNSSTTELNPHLWTVTAGDITFNDTGAIFTISKSGDSVTAESNFYIFGGTVEVIMRAAAGTGIISTFDLLSDDLDEIDLEIMGGNHGFVETNWYGWGNLTQMNAKYHEVDLPQEKMHNYTIVWDKDAIRWFVDGKLVRTLIAAEPGKYPQTPSRVKLGIWAGGDATQPEGTIEWAGGRTDWKKGPFTMLISSLKITDLAVNASHFTYTTQTGTWDSIKTVPGLSAAAKAVHRESLGKKLWTGLSSGAKVGIACGVIGFVTLCIVGFVVFFIMQRRSGRLEALRMKEEWDEQQSELLEYK